MMAISRTGFPGIDGIDSNHFETVEKMARFGHGLMKGSS